MSICCKETRRMVFASKLRTATEKLWIWYEWRYVGENKLRTWSQCLGFLTGLTWNRRVSEQCSRANKMLGFVKRNARHMQSTIVRRLIDLIIVRPHLGYATQGWAPQSIYFISNLEKIWRRATKYILKLPFSCCQSYEKRLKTLSLLPISYWHEYLDMLLFFKITHGLVDIDPTIVPITHSTRHTIVCQYSCY